MFKDFEVRCRCSVDGFKCVTRTESVLRKLVIDQLETIAGSRWHKTRLPPDVLDKMKKSAEYEKSFKWFEFVPHHPICYIDFPDIQKIISRDDNWRDCFKKFFNVRERFQQSYRDCELIRNKIAHSRLITPVELEKLLEFERELQICLSPELYSRLLAEHVSPGDIPEQLLKVRDFLVGTLPVLEQASPIEIPTFLQELEKRWWFDTDFIPVNTEAVVGVIRLLSQYCALPRQYRDGYKIESWINDSGLPAKVIAVAHNIETAICEVRCGSL